jgi:hypothetical protein
VTTTQTETSFPGPLAEFLANQIPRLAATAHRRHAAVPAEDYRQAMWTRALSIGPRLTQLHDNGQFGLITIKLRDECSRVTREDRRYQMAVEAMGNGYSVYDLEFYSTRVLGKLLPALVEADFDVSVAMEKAAASTDAAGIHIRSSDPFGGAENYLVILTDVTNAYRRLPEGMQRLLKTYYGVSQADDEQGRWDREGLASSMGLTSDALRQRAHRALSRLQGELGGSDPWL